MVLPATFLNKFNDPSWVSTQEWSCQRGSEVIVYVTKLSPGSSITTVGEEKVRKALSQYGSLPLLINLTPSHSSPTPASGTVIFKVLFERSIAEFKS